LSGKKATHSRPAVVLENDFRREGSMWVGKAKLFYSPRESPTLTRGRQKAFSTAVSVLTFCFYIPRVARM